jgi:hypothetical protein
LVAGCLYQVADIPLALLYQVADIPLALLSNTGTFLLSMAMLL